jgi:hypothetical protein
VTRDFHLGDILSIVGERLVSPKKMGAIYEILNYMTGDNLFTHQLPRANRECAPWLVRQHPVLGSDETKAAFDELDQLIESPDRQKPVPEIVHEWLAAQVKRIGETLPVEPIPMDDRDRVNPIEEAERMFPGKVVAVAIDEPEVTL